MSPLIYNALLVIHIIGVGIWIAQIPVELILSRVRAAMHGKPAELPVFMAQLRLLGVMGQFGGLAVLITGLALSVGTWGVFGAFTDTFTPTWLLIKQVLYVVALLLVFLVIQPNGRRIAGLLQRVAANAPVVTPEMRALEARMRTTSLAINAIVLVNVVLAVYKPA